MADWRWTNIPVVDGGVGEEGHVGGELAPEPENKPNHVKSHKKHCLTACDAVTLPTRVIVVSNSDVFFVVIRRLSALLWRNTFKTFLQLHSGQHDYTDYSSPVTVLQNHWWWFLYLPRQNLPSLLLLLWAVVRLSSGQTSVLVELRSNMNTRYPPEQLLHMNFVQQRQMIFLHDAFLPFVILQTDRRTNKQMMAEAIKKEPLKIKITFLMSLLSQVNCSRHPSLQENSPSLTSEEKGCGKTSEITQRCWPEKSWLTTLCSSCSLFSKLPFAIFSASFSLLGTCRQRKGICFYYSSVQCEKWSWSKRLTLIWSFSECWRWTSLNNLRHKQNVIDQWLSENALEWNKNIQSYKHY